MITPNLDDMVRDGVAFTRMYATSPCCSPSRASLFSGLYPHNTGVLRNDDKWTYTWVPMLAEAGYRCVNIGKMHTSPFEEPLGFHERHVVENKDRAHPKLPFYLDNWDKALWAGGHVKPTRETYCKRPDYNERLGAFVWELPERMHPDVFVAQSAVHWLEAYDGDEPFFLEIGLPGPHPPYDPTAEALALYEGRALPEPIRNYDLDTQPAALRKLRENHIENDHDAVVHLASPTREQMLRQRAHYYANITMIDEQIGALRVALQARGVADNTIIIFTSDHGDSLNDHGHSQKWNMFEPSVRVPAIIHNPLAPKRGRQIDDLTALFDFGPTILELAGVTPPDWMEARSLTSYFKHDHDPERGAVFSELADDMVQEDCDFMTMIRLGDWKLVYFLGSEEGQLFALESDPDETVNLWDSSDHADVRRALTQKILDWRLQSSRRTQSFVARETLC
jgi:arylsulfatase A-like enzyme